MSYGITLTKSALEDAVHNEYSVVRFRIDASDAVGLEDSRIFVYLRYPYDPYSASYFDEFRTVASPVDLVEYPPEEPGGSQNPQFFRLSYVELDFISVTAAYEFWGLVKAEVSALLEALNKNETLTTVNSVWIPDAPDVAAASASESTSTSESA